MASLRRCSNSLFRKVNLTGRAQWWEGGWREDIPGRGNCVYKSLFLLPMYQVDWFSFTSPGLFLVGLSVVGGVGV